MKRGWLRGAFAALAAVFCGGLQAAHSLVTINPKGPGRVYDGIGALSAGGSSRLLIDYPEPQRSEILDYLFKPNFGAALQINKVEIGGGMNSTDGSEPSHMRAPGDHGSRRGYEWWLMEESKKRNPAVKLYGLEWGAPGWINPSGKNVWTKENIAYLLDWVTHAKSDHNLTIDYLGGWNEREGNPSWFIGLRDALDRQGWRDLKIVADDAFRWRAGSVMATNPAYAASVQIIGTHYPEKIIGKGFDSNLEASLKTGKPLWGSEIGSADYNGGAVILARLYNRGYIEQRMTAFINWSTVWSVLPGLPFSGDGLMLADQPWSGSYEVGLSVWATAHTTQFAKPGWRYLDQACGYFVPENHAGGSHVALCSPDGKDSSVVVETVDATEPVRATFSMTGGLERKTLHVWRTKMEKNKPDDWFRRKEDVVPDKQGRFAMTFDPGCLYSLTTTEGQSKGSSSPPPRSPLPLPYRENFENTPTGGTPRYFSDQHGTFEAAPAQGGGKCLRQVVASRPVVWNSDADPGTLIGDPSWGDYTVRSDVLLEMPGYVELLGHVSGTQEQNIMPGYHLRLSDGTRWTLFYRTGAKKPQDIQLASGDLPSPAGTGKWHSLMLGFNGGQVTASIDGKTVVDGLTDHHADEAVSRKAIPCFTGYAASRWENAQFRNFEVFSTSQKQTVLPARKDGG